MTGTQVKIKDAPRASMPLFLNEEKERGDQLVAQLGNEVSNVYCLRVHDIDVAGEALEAILAGFLLTNAVLMSRTPRRIRKFISFNAVEESLVYAHCNLLRGLLQSNFTSLGEIETWKKLINDRWQVSPSITAAVADAVRFFETSGIALGAAAYHRAEIYLGIEGHQVDDPHGGQIYLDPTDSFSPVIRSRNHQYQVAMSDVFLRPGVQLYTGLKGRNVLVDIDCKQLDQAMQNWLGNLDHVLELDFYSAGTR